MGKVEIKTATLDDMEALCGVRFKRSLRAWSVYYDGELAAVAGLLMTKDDFKGFSQIKPGLVVPKITVWRTAVALLKQMTDLKRSFIVIADPSINGSPAFLQRLGFEYLTTSKLGEVYKWAIR